MAKTSILHCSFCGRSRDEVKILIAGQEGHICENCVDHAQEIIEQELNSKKDASGNNSSNFKLNVRKPQEIKNFLDEYVIGQDDAKKILCVAVLNKFLNTEGRINTLMDIIPQIEISFDKLTHESQKLYEELVKKSVPET